MNDEQTTMKLDIQGDRVSLHLECRLGDAPGLLKAIGDEHIQPLAELNDLQRSDLIRAVRRSLKQEAEEPLDDVRKKSRANSHTEVTHDIP